MPTTLTFDSLKQDFTRYMERGDNAVVDPKVYEQIPRLINLAERHLARRLKIQLAQNVVRSALQPGTAVYAKPDRWRDTISMNFGDSKYKYRTVSRSSAAGARTLVLDGPHFFEAGDGIVVNGVDSSTYNGTFTVSAVTQLSVSYVTGSLTESSTADVGGYVASNMNKRTPLLARAYEYCREYWKDDDETSAPQFYADYDLNHWLIAPTPDRPYPYEILYHELPPLLDDANQQNVWTDYAPEALLYGTLLEATPYLKNDSRIPTWQAMYDRALSDLKGEDLQKIIDRSASRTEA